MVLGDEAPDALGLNGVADYTFTDQELTDILGYMESHDPVGAHPPFAAPSGNFQALQFLPRSHGNLATPHGVDFAGASAAQGSVKSEPIVSDYKGELGVFPLPEPAQTRQSPSYTPRGTQRPGQNGHKGDLPSGRKHSTKKGSHARTGSGEYRHGHISHSTVEKQRRDRINALIDELRELVPSQSSDGPPQEGNSDSRRPKHVVLSDTIALVKDLQIRVRDTPPHSCTVSGEAEEVRSPDTHDAPAAPSSAPDPPASDQDSERSGSPSEPQKSRDGSSPLPNVTVECSESWLSVKVNCKDRRGLLSDIIMALKSMPLEITTASVLTGQDGYVQDVFQVKPDPRGGLSPQDVQRHVLASLDESDAEGLGDKRRRTEEVQIAKDL